MPVEHYENFPVASWLLPAKLRLPIEHIYAFARTADDFADEGAFTQKERLHNLNEYRQALNRIARGEPAESALFENLGETIRRHELPIQLFRDLLDAFSQDVTKTRYANFAELMDYCRRSADPIGRLLIHLYKMPTDKNFAWSDSICSALQLINHWQDVAIDWKKNEGGRVYLPQDELARFGLSDHSIANQTSDSAWTKLMRFQCDRARAMMIFGKPLGRVLPGRMGAELRLIIAGGISVLDKIDAASGDVFRHRPKLNKWDWMRIAPRALLGP